MDTKTQEFIGSILDFGTKDTNDKARMRKVDWLISYSHFTDALFVCRTQPKPV